MVDCVQIESSLAKLSTSVWYRPECSPHKRIFYASVPKSVILSLCFGLLFVAISLSTDQNLLSLIASTPQTIRSEMDTVFIYRKITLRLSCSSQATSIKITATRPKRHCLTTVYFSGLHRQEAWLLILSIDQFKHFYYVYLCRSYFSFWLKCQDFMTGRYHSLQRKLQCSCWRTILSEFMRGRSSRGR